MKRLDNKGYMLIEIVLASVIAFGVAYYMLDVIIKLKNKNDDMLVETLTMTDQAIIMNKIVGYLDTLDNFDNVCTTDNKLNNLSINDKEVKYNEETIDIVNNYAVIGKTVDADGTSKIEYSLCENDIDKQTINITIPLSVKQINKNFDIHLSYKY